MHLRGGPRPFEFGAKRDHGGLERLQPCLELGFARRLCLGGKGGEGAERRGGEQGAPGRHGRGGDPGCRRASGRGEAKEGGESL